ncbi:MAG: cell division protein ZipA C-terminal FtsZ-binding domain-containing protein [Betaproteobacteria bacterium]
MNPLFLGLLAAGVALVAVVILYNWMQERRARRRIESAFSQPADAVPDRERVEPQLRMEATAAASSAAVETGEEPDDLAPMAAEPLGEALPDVLPATRAERPGTAPDADIECVVHLEPQQPVRGDALSSVLAAHFAKPSRWLGRRGRDLAWQSIESAHGGPWEEIAACMLLANRAGAASREDVQQFLHEVARAGASLPAAFALPDPAAEAGRGEELDRFCADLDVQVGLTILRSDGQIAGTRLRGVAEAAGFRLNSTGSFDLLQDENGATLYSLQNYRQEALTVESLRQLSTPGVVLLLDVPRVADPVRVFDQMRLAAKRMAHTLEGVLVDDNRRPLNDASLASIRAEVQATAVALREANIEPGGPRALRLFG